MFLLLLKAIPEIAARSLPPWKAVHAVAVLKAEIILYNCGLRPALGDRYRVHRPGPLVRCTARHGVRSAPKPVQGRRYVRSRAAVKGPAATTSDHECYLPKRTMRVISVPAFFAGKDLVL